MAKNETRRGDEAVPSDEELEVRVQAVPDSQKEKAREALAAYRNARNLSEETEGLSNWVVTATRKTLLEILKGGDPSARSERKANEWGRDMRGGER